MNATSIGIQVIMPQTGTSPQSAPQQQANEREHTANEAAAHAPPPPPPQGVGKLVDKTV